MLYAIIRIFGFLGLAFSIASFLFRRHKQIVMCKMFSTLSFAIQYLFIGPGAYTAAFLDLVSSVRNFLYYKFVEKNKSTTPLIIIFATFMALVGVFTWAGPITLLATIPKVMTSISYAMKKEWLLRIITMPTCICWIAYNLIVGSYEAALGDFITFLTIVYAIIKYDIIEKKKTV